MRLASRSGIITRYPSRNVRYMVGDEDTFQNGNMDDSCAANLQGTNRFARGLNYFNYMNEFFPKHTHKLITIPGASHSSKEMFLSSEGKKMILWKDKNEEYMKAKIQGTRL